MRIPSGATDQVIYFVAVDSTDLTTRKTGLASFTVYRARNGNAAAVFTTPTLVQVSLSNMPGVYSLLLDEDMTIDTGKDSQAVALHITHAGMAPVTLTYELYRPTVIAAAIGTDIAAIKTDILAIKTDLVALGTSNAAIGTSSAAIKAKTDLITFAGSLVAVNVKKLNDATLIGNGVAPKFGV